MFFRQLPGIKYHVNCAASSPEPALRFRQDNIYNVLKKMGEHDFSPHFACHCVKGDATTVVTFCSVTFSLVHMNNVGIFQFLWETLSGPAVRDKIMQPSVENMPTILNDLSRDVVRTGCFVIFETENGLFNFVKGWWIINFGMIGCVGRSSGKPGSMMWTLFSWICRYSAHVASIYSLFLSRTPSILLTGCKEKRVGA